MRIAKKIFITVAFSAIFSTSAYTQTLEWAKGIGGVGCDMGNSIAIDNSGNIYTTGYFRKTVDFDPGPGVYNLTTSNNSISIFISKLDALGNFVWAKKIGQYGTNVSNAIALDSYGNVYTTGSFDGTRDFDPGTGIFNLTSTGLSDAFISKLDSSGNFVWAKSLGGLGSYDYGKYIALDTIGNIYTVGNFDCKADFDPGIDTFYIIPHVSADIFISKLNSSGNFVWAKSIGGPNEEEEPSIAIDPSGNVYSTGWLTGTTDFDPGPAVHDLTSMSFGFSDIFISKLDSSGNFVWVNQISGPYDERGYSITYDPFNNIYITGAFQGTVDFDPGVGIYNLTALPESGYTFILKLDTAGNFIWAKPIVGTTSNNAIAIKHDSQGNIYTTGELSETADFDPGPGIFELTSVGAADIFILKLDSYGNFVWAKRMGGIVNDFSRSIAVDISGNVYTTGQFEETVCFDPEYSTYNLTSVGSCDIFVCKLMQKGVIGIVNNDINSNCIRDSNELSIQNRFVTITPGNIIAQTNDVGVWVIDSLPVGIYTAIVDTSGNWQVTCPILQTFSVINPNEITFVSDFGIMQPVLNVNPTYKNNSKLLVYPNPASDKIDVELLATNSYNNCYYSIFSIDGKKVIEGSLLKANSIIATSNLENGLYFLEVRTENDKFNEKLIIAK